MSLRPELSGFSLATLRAQFGSGDEGLLDSCREALRVMVEFDDPQELDRAVQVVEQAVLSGVPFPDLDVEGEPHVVAAIALALNGQDHLPTDSNIWKLEAFEELSQILEGTLSDPAGRCLRYLIDGRALFGETIETEWNYYAYLTQDEVKTLRAGLEEAKGENPDPTEDGFLGDFLEWLVEISDSGLDLWFHAA